MAGKLETADAYEFHFERDTTDSIICCIQTRCGSLRGKTVILFALLLTSIPYLYTVLLARTTRSAAQLLDSLSELSSVPDSACSYSYKQGSSFLLSTSFRRFSLNLYGTVLVSLSFHVCLGCFRDHSVSESVTASVECGRSPTTYLGTTRRVISHFTLG